MITRQLLDIHSDKVEGGWLSAFSTTAAKVRKHPPRTPCPWKRSEAAIRPSAVMLTGNVEASIVRLCTGCSMLQACMTRA